MNTPKRKRATKDLDKETVALKQIGFSPWQSEQIAKAKLTQSVMINTYAACKAPKLGFKRVDPVARRYCGVDDPERLEAALEHGLSAESTARGSTCVSQKQLVSALAELLGSDQAAEAAWRYGCQAGIIRRSPCNRYSPTRFYRDEQAIARFVAELSRCKQASAEVSESRLKGLSQKQAEAVGMIAKESISLLTGSAGSGKTTTLKAAINVLKDNGVEFLLLAPTGKAARRMKEATGADAMTIHSAAYRHLSAEMIIIDEASMLSSEVLRLVVDMNPTRLALVGDPKQLPPVGAGHPFRDLIESGTLPGVHLDRVFRQSEGSGLLDQAYRILAGKPPEATESGDVQTLAEAEKSALAAFEGLLDMGIDADSIQIVAATNRVCDEINEAASDLLAQRRNDPPMAFKSKFREWRVYDRIVFTQNDAALGVINGMQARILSPPSAAGELAFKILDTGEAKTLPIEALDNAARAYCVTVHKAQGSEWPHIIALLEKRSTFLQCRRWLYTALTRASQSALILFDDAETLERSAQNEGLRRTTTLPAFLSGQGLERVQLEAIE